MFKKIVSFVTTLFFTISITAPHCQASVYSWVSEVSEEGGALSPRNPRQYALMVRQNPEVYADVFCQDPEICRELRRLLPRSERDNNKVLALHLSSHNRKSDVEEGREESDDDQEESASVSLASSFRECAQGGCRKLSTINFSLLDTAYGVGLDGLFLFNGLLNMSSPFLAQLFDNEETGMAYMSFTVAFLQCVAGFAQKQRDRRLERKTKAAKERKKKAQLALYHAEKKWVGEGSSPGDVDLFLPKNPARSILAQKKPKNNTMPLIADLGSDAAFFLVGSINLFLGLSFLVGDAEILKALVIVSGVLQAIGLYLKKLKNNKDWERSKRQVKKTEDCQHRAQRLISRF